MRALRALTPGVRGLLPFRAPELLGEAGLGDARAVVVDFLPGYRVDAAHLPPGRGAATSIGEALAALHALPLSIVRTEGLPVRTPQQVRDDVARLIDRAEATRARAERARSTAGVARSRPTSSGASSPPSSSAAPARHPSSSRTSTACPQVTGLLEWHGLSVGDPATDLQWLASAPAAADDVYAAYVAHSGRAPDARARERARLYAELEFAKWLVHGHEAGRDDIIDDAVGLLESLAAGVRGDDIVPDCRPRRRRRDRAARPHARRAAGRRRHLDADRRLRSRGAVAVGRPPSDARRRRRRPTTPADAPAPAPAAARRRLDGADRHLGVRRSHEERDAASPVDGRRRRRRADAERASEAALRRWLAE